MSKYRFFDPEYDDFLQHYGTPGMKHGVRNYQFLDGTWTELGKERRRIGDRRILDRESEVFSKSIWNDVVAVNESVGSSNANILDDPFRRNNCGYCAIAYTLRRDGWDAKAKPAMEGLDNPEIEDVFNKKFDTPESTYRGVGLDRKAYKIYRSGDGQPAVDDHGHPVVDFDEPDTPELDARFEELYKRVAQTSFTKPEIRRIEKEFASQGEGARGIIGVEWSDPDGSGHWFNYEVHNKNVYLVDSQIREIYRGLGQYLGNAYSITYMRTDGAEVNKKEVDKMFENKFKKKNDVLKMSLDLLYSEYLQHEGVGMTIEEVVTHFKKAFPNLEISTLRKVDDWYVFTIGNAPRGKNGVLRGAIDPYIGYNVRTKEFERLSPPMLGVKKFFSAKPIAF